MSENDRYLWDKSGDPDPDVESLERLLSPLAHRADAKPPAVVRRLPWIAYAAAAVVALALGAHLVTRSPDGPGDAPPEAPRYATAFRVAAGDAEVALGSWIHATDAPREVTLGTVARLTLDPGSRLRLDAAETDGARFTLERGRLEARVSADAKPRFFQVDTRAARCVDLGCVYSLAVAADGVAHVRVTTGQVAFASGDREVYVPAGAGCRASPGTGPGTPRFSDASESLSAALDAFDAAAGGAPGERRALAAIAYEAMKAPRDALAALDMLQDPDDVIAIGARAAIVRQAGAPGGPAAGGAGRPDAAERERFKEHLERAW